MSALQIKIIFLLEHNYFNVELASLARFWGCWSCLAFIDETKICPTPFSLAVFAIFIIEMFATPLKLQVNFCNFDNGIRKFITFPCSNIEMNQNFHTPSKGLLRQF